jgi:hypothetical protein
VWSERKVFTIISYLQSRVVAIRTAMKATIEEPIRTKMARLYAGRTDPYGALGYLNGETLISVSVRW